ncbi:beta-ketoacyl-ACP reductase [Dictyobacter sp. S3.2.2.5]|uniref:Beta-ketoacyl-ACP reductase n=1 Tax=Dictyobacter halimunensis TaxID=3026934 RepID=A0ABQ6FIP5_9CHLR|nr:beta-ketoacyl-ACP reductase [Dictyobacter sp. S3.2.2.5]
MRLKERVAVVTGSGSGIGRAIAQIFAAEGAAVVVVDRVGDRARETVSQLTEAGGKALAVVADVASARDVEAIVSQALQVYGRVDILVNNAGLALGDDILSITEEEWDTNLAVVLKSVYLCSRALLPGMIERGQGAIVNIASVNGLNGLGEEAYSAAKAGMINLTKNMAVKYGSSGVRVNCICPGTIRTPIFQPDLERDPQLFERLAKWYPLGRVGEPEDIARAALFLASDDASWITGTAMVVDGGLLAGSYRMARELTGFGED